MRGSLPTFHIRFFNRRQGRRALRWIESAQHNEFFRMRFGLKDFILRSQHIGHRELESILDDRIAPDVSRRLNITPAVDERMHQLLTGEQYLDQWDPINRFNFYSTGQNMQTVYHKTNSDLEFPLEPEYQTHFKTSPVYRQWHVVDGIDTAKIVEMFESLITVEHRVKTCHYSSSTFKHEQDTKHSHFMEKLYIFTELNAVVSLLTGYDDTARIVIMAQSESAVDGWWSETVQRCKGFTKTPLRDEPTFNIIVQESSGFSMREFKIAKLEDENFIANNYNDDFQQTAADIVSQLREKTRGITLLHGKPGTGKTNFIRYLANEVTNKTIVYIPPELAQSLADPSFVSFIMDNPKSIFIIEDAENVIRTRESGGSNAVANILNMSDGIIGDAVQCQFVCTFNCEYHEVDSALKRKGRLNAAYEFDALSLDKTHALVEKLYGSTNQVVDGEIVPVMKGLTLAEIYNLNTPTYSADVIKKRQIGFSM